MLATTAVGRSITTVVSDGVAERPSRHVALHNARIVTEPGRVIEHGVIEIRDGRIVGVTAGDRLPAGAEPRDLHGKTVFAGLIDLAASVGVPAGMRKGGIAVGSSEQSPHEQQLDQPGARHWNRRVRPELSVAQALVPVADDVKAMRDLGFAAALATPEAGIFRGQSALISLRDAPRTNGLQLRADVAQHVGFDFAYGSEYPGSLMGAIALIRQTLLDAQWQADTRAAGTAKSEANLALDALGPVVTRTQPIVFQLSDELDVDRVAKLRSELGFSAVLLGSGYEYRVLDAVRAAGLPIILPLGYPEAPAVEDAESALSTSLAELQHWEQAPANPARVAAAGAQIALTPNGLADAKKSFWPNVRKAVAAGLSEDAALGALTLTPAALLGESARLGRVSVGQLANLLVADATLFRSDEAKTFEVWVEGERYELQPLAPAVAAGSWTLHWSDGVGPTQWTVSGAGEALDVVAGETTFTLQRDGDAVIGLPPASLFGGSAGHSRIRFRLDEQGARGFRTLADGRQISVNASVVAAAVLVESGEEPAHALPKSIPAFVGYPAGEYAHAQDEPPSVVLIRGATLWTNTAQGLIANGELLVRNGKIAALGRGLSVPDDARVVDASGWQLTPGIIDAHSHTAIARGVNEPSHAVTTEVRVVDVIDPTDINIYRQLAGGVTTANLLHGSANPMGGQNAVIKMRWGADADGLLMRGAPAGVKFALGENVKQSNWGDSFSSRYPQTRMGVEQIMREHFNAARAYAAARAGKKGSLIRRDLRLEAIAEVLASQRFIHIHSYRADELLMFVRLAQDFGLRGVTFQHVLEGYKVAPEMASIGAGASTFSDWWSYKLEAYDGTPYQAALLANAGVSVSFNSDSDEMARRLNAEAAKAMKYGGMTAEEALKLVTLNPAKQLGIDDRVGALRPGMDADFVLWNGSPLSALSRAEQTWVDGQRMFDRTEDAALQVRDLAERERLLAAAAAARVEQLALAASEPAAKKSAEAASVPAATQTPEGLYPWLRYASGRGLYGAGQTFDSCEAQAHAH